MVHGDTGLFLGLTNVKHVRQIANSIFFFFPAKSFHGYIVPPCARGSCVPNAARRCKYPVDRVAVARNHRSKLCARGFHEFSSSDSGQNATPFKQRRIEQSDPQVAYLFNLKFENLNLKPFLT